MHFRLFLLFWCVNEITKRPKITIKLNSYCKNVSKTIHNIGISFKLAKYANVRNNSILSENECKRKRKQINKIRSITGRS